MNVQLQRDDSNLNKTKNVIAAFIANLLLTKGIVDESYNNFLNLSTSSSNDDLLINYQHLENLNDDCQEPFEHIRT